MRIDKGMKRKKYKHRVTALAAVIFMVGSSLPPAYAAETLREDMVEKKPRIMDMERERKPETVKRIWEEIAVQEQEKRKQAEQAGVETDGSAPGEEGELPLTEEEKKEEAQIDAYFEDTVFVGDSIMLGFRNYAMKRQDTFLSRPQFLAAGSFSVNNALWQVDEDSVHPVYQGEQRQIWDSVAMMGSRKIFLMFGMNDLNINGIDGTCEKYKELIGKFLEQDPEAQIHIMSMTYILKGKEKGMLKNETIREFNEKLKRMAEENGWGYVDIADPLADENGFLAEEYCSDEFAHQRPEAYDVWVNVLRDYARKILTNKEEGNGTQV